MALSSVDANAIQISVLLVTGVEVARLEVQPEATVRLLKKKIAAADGTQMECQKLVAGTHLLRNRQTIAEVGLVDGDSIHLVRVAPPSGVTRGNVGYEPTDEAIDNYAESIGMSLDEDRDLLGIAEEGVKALLPAGWVSCSSESSEGRVYFFNRMSGHSQWEHPLDEMYRAKYQKAKADMLVTQMRANAAERETRWADTLAEAKLLVKTAGSQCRHEASKEEVEAYARALGMSLTEDNDLLRIAEEGLKDPLPAEWKRCISQSGATFYFNVAKNHSQWEHPLTEVHRAKYKEAKAKTYVTRMAAQASMAEASWAEALAEAHALVTQSHQQQSPHKVDAHQSGNRSDRGVSALGHEQEILWQRRWWRPSKQGDTCAELRGESRIATLPVLKQAAVLSSSMLPSLPSGVVTPYGCDAWRSMSSNM